MKVAVIPALNEAGAIGEVVRGIARSVDKVVVVDNGSTDLTAERARDAGADVVSQPARGYGAACHAGISRARALGATVILFLDGDGSDHPDDAPLLLGPVETGAADLALGVRTAETTEAGAMTGPQRFGNWFAPLLMRRLLGAPFTDMPPFKAIRVEALDRLALREQTYGFTIELLLEAHRRQLRIVERPVRSRARLAGVSKVSGTLQGSARAGVRILSAIGRYALTRRR